MSICVVNTFTETETQVLNWLIGLMTTASWVFADVKEEIEEYGYDYKDAETNLRKKERH